MAVTEEARHDLYTYYQETMGRERAGTLMALLPPEDVATKGDLMMVRKDLMMVRDELKGEITVQIAELRSEFHNIYRKQTMALLMAMVAISSVGTAAVAAVGAVVG